MTPARSPLTYQKIEDTLRELINQERKLVREFCEAGDSLAAAEIEFKHAYAKARATARENFRRQGVRTNEDMVGDEAIIDVHEAFAEYTAAKTTRENLKTRVASAHAQMDVLRSLMASHRELSDAQA